MRIDWGALLLVAVTTLAAATAMILIVAGAARLTVVAQARSESGRPAWVPRGASWLLFALAGLVVLFGIYLIVPYFR